MAIRFSTGYALQDATDALYQRFYREQVQHPVVR
jgi:hypothetical protein